MKAPRIHGTQKFLGIALLTVLANGHDFPTVEEFESWTDSISSRIASLAVEETDVKALSEAYNREESRIRASFEKLDGLQIANDAARSIGDLFGKRKDAVQSIAKNAEAVAANYTFQQELIHADLQYVNVKHVGRLDKELLKDDNMYPVTKITNISLAYNNVLKRPVNFSVSGVHIPLEVYEGYLDVLNGLNWTHNLEDVFRANHKQDPTIHWQYFAGSNGIIRIYPAFRWQTAPHVPDLYDARKRLWYAQSQSSPKDIIILLDRSGSIHGPSFEIMKITAKTILGTLGENDFFNIAQFTLNTTWLVPCFANLVQATTANKQLFHEAIDRLTPNNKASYANALTFAFESFKRFKKSNTEFEGAGCSRAIFLLSDGGTEHPLKTIKEYQQDPDTSDVRIFTVAVGPHPIPTVSLKQMACVGRGHFSAIMTLGAIRSKTQEYLKTLGKPVALSHDDQLLQWSSTYEDAGGLGPTVSITRPVFNTLRGSIDDQQVLGVAGVDIPISAIEEKITKKSLGRNVYSFALTQNGMVLYHPDLMSHVNVLEDPMLIDILNLESDTPEIQSIRKDMIDRIPGSKTVRVPVFSGDYAYEEERTYYYRPIGNSTYSFAIVTRGEQVRMTLSEDHQIYNQTLLDPKTKQILRDHNATLLVVPWAQCSLGDTVKVATIDSLDGLAHTFDMTINKCKPEVVQHLFWDLRNAVDTISTAWSSKQRNGILSRFIATDGGIALVQNQRSSFVSTSLSDIHKNAFYQRLTRSDTDVVVGIASKIENGKLKSRIVLVSRAALRRDDSVSAQVSAAGIELSTEYFRKLLMDETSKSEKANCANHEDLVCLLLDEAGHVVATNQQNMPLGTFLGSPYGDAQLMSALVSPSVGIFQQVIRHRPLSACPKWVSSEKCSSSAYSFTSQSVGKVVGSLFQNSLVVLQYWLLSIFAWILPTVTPPVEGGNALTEIGLDFLRPPKIKTRLCSTRSAYYRLLLKPNSTSFHGFFSCPETGHFEPKIVKRSVSDDGSLRGENVIPKVLKGECTREFQVKRLSGSNLVFVVAKPECQCATKSAPLLHAPIEDTESKVCNSTGRYRRRLALCYATNTKEKTEKCHIPTSGASVTTSVMASVALVFFSVGISYN